MDAPAGCIVVPEWVAEMIDDLIAEQNPLRTAIKRELQKPRPWDDAPEAD